MRVAYLFSEKHPNYLHDFTIFQHLRPEDFLGLDTLIRIGAWGYQPTFRGAEVTSSTVWNDLYQLFLSGHGNIHRITEPLIAATLNGNVYTVQFYSIKRSIALYLDQQLKGDLHYLGFTQVISRVRSHNQVFDWCPPRYHIQDGKIYVLFSGSSSDMDLGTSDDEECADQIIQWVEDNNNPLPNLATAMRLEKRSTKARHSILSLQEDPTFMAGVQTTIHTLLDEWESSVEKAVYSLQETVPDSLQELMAATKLLAQPSVSSIECAQIAVSLRRVLENLTDAYCPPKTQEAKEKGGWVKKQWLEFVEAQKKTKQFQAEQLGAEAMALDDALERLGRLYVMGNKGVHENVDPSLYRSTLLRMVLLIHDVMALKRARRRTKFDQAALYQLYPDEEEQIH